MSEVKDESSYQSSFSQALELNIFEPQVLTPDPTGFERIQLGPVDN